MLKFVTVFFLMLVLSGCSSGAVVFAPTPLPPDAVPLQFEHTSGAFSLLLPRDWSVYTQQSGNFASASFAPPRSDTPLVHVAVVNLGREITLDDLQTLLNQYQTQIRPDIGRYTQQDQQAMGDGSWRITGVRQTPSQQPQQVNTFIQRSGMLFSVMDVVLPQEAAIRTQVQTIINTFVLAATADLPVSDLVALSSVAGTPLEIVSISTWTTTEGIFFVTGEIANHGDLTYAEVPVRVQLLDEEGNVVADAFDYAMGHAVVPDGFAPFGIRFGQGQPINAVQYRIQLGSDDAPSREVPPIISYPQLEWVDSTQYTQDGDLFVTGTVTNSSTTDVQLPRAIVTLFDDRGRVIGTGFADADNAILAAGEQVNFTVLISDLGGVPVNYVVNIQALPCDANCE